MPIPFAKGNPGKPKGAVNKVSQKVRESIVEFLENNVDQIQMDFDTLKPRERLDFIADLIPYAAPKLQSIQMDHSGDISLEITFKDAE
jgi:hypothetical protein